MTRKDSIESRPPIPYFLQLACGLCVVQLNLWWAVLFRRLLSSFSTDDGISIRSENSFTQRLILPSSALAIKHVSRSHNPVLFFFFLPLLCPFVSAPLTYSQAMFFSSSANIFSSIEYIDLDDGPKKVGSKHCLPLILFFTFGCARMCTSLWNFLRKKRGKRRRRTWSVVVLVTENTLPV